mmetsp:Transcript_110419/g.308761  ORF Transcript_110419/g.308761 Transcript_110419/m.308761 type:complete len:356 (+) Transcript_110419:1320-2387(+)
MIRLVEPWKLHSWNREIDDPNLQVLYGQIELVAIGGVKGAIEQVCDFLRDLHAAAMRLGTEQAVASRSTQTFKERLQRSFDAESIRVGMLVECGHPLQNPRLVPVVRIVQLPPRGADQAKLGLQGRVDHLLKVLRELVRPADLLLEHLLHGRLERLAHLHVDDAPEPEVVGGVPGLPLQVLHRHLRNGPAIPEVHGVRRPQIHGHHRVKPPLQHALDRRDLPGLAGRHGLEVGHVEIRVHVADLQAELAVVGLQRGHLEVGYLEIPYVDTLELDLTRSVPKVVHGEVERLDEARDVPQGPTSGGSQDNLLLHLHVVAAVQAQGQHAEQRYERRASVFPTGHRPRSRAGPAWASMP